MVDELKPVDKSWLLEQIRFRGRYLTDYVEDIAVNKEALAHLRFHNRDRKGKEEIKPHSPYDDLEVSEEKPHSLDESI